MTRQFGCPVPLANIYDKTAWILYLKLYLWRYSLDTVPQVILWQNSMDAVPQVIFMTKQLGYCTSSYIYDKTALTKQLGCCTSSYIYDKTAWILYLKLYLWQNSLDTVPLVIFMTRQLGYCTSSYIYDKTIRINYPVSYKRKNI